MAQFRVVIDFSASATLYVNADSPEQAEEIALREAKEDAMWCVRHNGWIGDACVWSDGTEEVTE